MSQYQYSPLVGPLTTATPLETTTGWQSPTGQVAHVTRRAGIITALTVAACVLPATFAQGAVNPPTGWRPTYPDRVVRKVVHPAHQPFYTTRTFQPAEVVITGGSFLATGSIQFIQYQSIAAAFADPPPVSSFESQIDPVYPATIHRRTTHPSRMQAFVTDRADAPAAPSVTALSWSPRYPNRIVRKTFPTALQRAYTADTATVPGILASQQIAWLQRGLDAPRRPFRLATYVWGQQHFGVVIEVPVMSWTGVYLDPPVRLKPRQFGGVVAPVDITATPPAPDSSWAPRFPDRIPARPRKTAALTSAQHGLIFVPDVTLVVPASSWQGRYPDRVPAKPRVVEYRAFSMDRITAPAPVVVPDLAAPVYVNQVYGKARIVVFPAIHMVEGREDPPPVVPELAWLGLYPDAINPLPGLLAGQQVAFMFWPEPIPTPPAVETDHELIVPFRIRLMEVDGHLRLVVVPFRTRRIV